MYKGKKILGLVTARGGSKGIPGKNIKILGDKPLLAYSILAAQQSQVLDRIVLSTDDQKIADVGKKLGVEVPFIRPTALAVDTASSLGVVQHAVEWLRGHEQYFPDFVIILQPTSPLRQAFHIKEAIDLLLSSDFDSVLSVGLIPENFNPSKAMIINEEGSLRLFSGRLVGERVARRQELKDAYWSTGAIYAFKTELVLSKENPNFYGNRVMPYVVEDKYTIDINTPDDWQKAEMVLRDLKINNLN